MWFAIGFGAVCALCAYCAVDAWMIPLILISGILTAGFAVAGRRWQGILRAAFLFLGCAVGLVWFSGFQRYYLLPALAVDGTTIETTVTATDYSYETTYGSAVDGKVELEGKTYQIRVYINDNVEINPGDTITGQFKTRYTAPGGEKEATYHQGKGIFLLGYQRGTAEILPADEDQIKYYPSILAQNIKDRLRELFPEDVFSFTQALLLGDSTELSYETDTAFQISGIRHIIAVSGLHVTILYTMLSAVTFRKRYLTALLGFPTLFLFAAMAGFTPSVTRACIMVGLMILAQLFNKEYDSPTALGFAALVMLAANPLVITSVGFQLSVGCVAGILLFQKPVNEWMKARLGNPKGKGIRAVLARWFISSISVTLGAMSLTTPLSAYYFGAVSLIGVVTNLLTLWVVNFIFNGLVLTCLMSLLSVKAAGILAWLIAWPIRFVLWSTKLLAGFPMAAVYTASPYIVAWLVFVYILLAVFLLSRKKHPKILACCGALSLCLALLASWVEPLTDDCRITVLDVGQGQSILLQSEGRTYLIDCGGDSDTEAADTVAETLLSQGISRLDGIIVTHEDRDHAGGVANLLTRIQTDLLLIPATADAEMAAQITAGAEGKVVFVSEDLKITFGATEITIFAPIFVDEDNENSLCVLFDTENCDILVTGDRSTLGEMLLMLDHTLPDVDVLIVGHHGSKYSTSELLLQTVQPEVAVISVGGNNTYGHPTQEVLDRLDAIGCRVYRTDENGTIIIRR